VLNINKQWKWVVIILLIVSGLGYYIYGKYTFRFQNFETAEQLQLYITDNFPTGSNAKFLLQKLKKGGATCKLIDKKYYDKSTPKNTKEYYFCNYGHWEFSLDLLIGFTIDIYIEDNGKIINFYVGRHPEAI